MADLIDREKAIRLIKTECNPFGKPTIDFESGKKVIEFLEKMPSAQPKRKKGKWIQHGAKEGFLIERYTCSVCSYYSGTKTSNFCPDCGADMKGENNAEIC